MSEKFKVLTLKMIYDPNENIFTNNIEGNPDLQCSDLIEILNLLSDSVKKSKCKTMGEFFKTYNK